jgi:hypothetical protein
MSMGKGVSTGKGMTMAKNMSMGMSVVKAILYPSVSLTRYAVLCFAAYTYARVPLGVSRRGKPEHSTAIR